VYASIVPSNLNLSMINVGGSWKPVERWNYFGTNIHSPAIKNNGMSGVIALPVSRNVITEILHRTNNKIIPQNSSKE